MCSAHINSFEVDDVWHADEPSVSWVQTKYQIYCDKQQGSDMWPQKKKKNPHRTNNNNKKTHQPACQHSDMASGDPFNSTVSHELRAAVYELSRRLNLLGC